MTSKYELLEDSHETSVYEGDNLIAVFFGDTRWLRAQRFVDREEYLDQIAESLCEYDSRLIDDE